MHFIGLRAHDEARDGGMSWARKRGYHLER